MGNSSDHKFNFSEKRDALLQMLAEQEDLDSPCTSVIPLRDKSKPVPLSFAQQRLWFLAQLEPNNSLYNIPLALRLTGHLNVSALKQSLDEILRRHEVLRTTFPTENDKPVQKIQEVTAFTLFEEDLSKVSDEKREAMIRELAIRESSHIFDIAKGPLLRATLVYIKPEEHMLLLTLHHIIADGWSMGILYRELSALYEALLKGDLSPIQDLPVQYADFSVWQRQLLHGEELEKHLCYWKEQLRDMAPFELSTDHPRPSVQTYSGAIHTFQFPKGLTEELQSLNRSEGVTLFMTLVTAFQGLLHRYTGQDDIVVGTPIANRNQAEIEGLIGFFVNTIVIRTDLSGDPVFRELLNKVRKAALDAYAHQDLPFEKLVEELKPERDLSRNPLFQVMFALQNVPSSTMEMPDLMLSLVEIECTKTRFDIEVYLTEEEDGLNGVFIYNPDLFDAVTIERIALHYQNMLEGIVKYPDQRISELPLIKESELHQLLMAWNDTATDYPGDKCIHDLFEEQAERAPDATAVIHQEQRLTYKQLSRRSSQLAYYLKKQGAGPGVQIGICVERSTDMIIGILGILKTGGTYVPLDPEYPKERLAFMLDDTAAPLLLTQQHMANMLPDRVPRVIYLDNDLMNNEQEIKEKAINGTTSDNLAYVMYTSGSTGRPKGVCISHRAVIRLIKNTNYININYSDIVAHVSNFSFDAATFEIWGALLNGACLTVIDKNLLISPEDFAVQISKQKISTLFLTTALFNQMAQEAPAAFRFLRYLLFGGETVDTACVRMVIEAGAPEHLLHVYGPTENTTFTSWYPVEELPEKAATVPIGRPVANTSIYLLDNSLQPVPVGIVGEIYIGGDGLASGYFNRPELSAEKFIPDPFDISPGARLYKTGDLGRYRSDGNIEFMGRIDNQVKIRGFRIEPGEIEAVIRQYPAVRETVVLVREDHPGNKRLAAYVVPDKKTTITINELRGFLKKQLPDYMVPAVFVHLEILPITANGKVDHKALPVPGNNIIETGRVYEAPRNELETRLAEIWEKVLGVHPIGITDNFFDLGGHSLLAVMLTSEIRKITDKDFPVIALFHNQTIKQLAAIIADKKWSVQWSSAVPIHSGGSKKPIFSVHDTNMARFLEPDQPLYLLTHPSKDDNLAPYSTVEKIAAKNIVEMRSVQPEGPYIIGGFCFWAIVALEMAHQLIKQGYELSLLFLVDPSDIALPQELLRDTMLSSDVLQHVENLTPQSNNEKLVCLSKKVLHKLKSKAQYINHRTKMLICMIYLHMGRPLPYALRSFYFPELYVEKIMDNYIPKLYPGKAVLFFHDIPCQDAHEKWNNLITGGVEIHRVPGAAHLNILRDPYVGIWAQILNTYLEKAQEPEDVKAD